MIEALNMAEAAAHYCGRYKFAIVPIPPRSKGPTTPGWNLPAQCLIKPGDAERYYRENPQNNAGILHSASRTCSFDNDAPKHASVVLAHFGIDAEQLRANFPTVQGQPGRWRTMFQAPDGAELAAHKLTWPDPDRPGERITIFELRAGPVQDVLPPSIHPSGAAYAWLTPLPEAGELPGLPAELLAIWNNWREFEREAAQLCPWRPQEPPRDAPKPKARPEGTASVIDAYNEAHSVPELLERHGYQKRGKKYLAPNSSSGYPGITILDDGRCFSHHGSDPLGDGHAHDAFDLLVLLDHGGDFSKATKAAALELGIGRGPSGEENAGGTRAKGAIGAKNGTNASSTPGRIAGESGRILDRVRELLGADSFESQPYPVNALGLLAEPCQAIAELGQLAPAMAGQCVLTAASLLVQSRADVRTLAGIKPLSLYALTIADSAEGKSTAEDAALHQIREYQRRAGKKYREEVKLLAQEPAKGKKGEPAADAPRKPYMIGMDGTIEGIRRDFAEGVPSQAVFTSEAATMMCGYGMNADNRSKTAAAFSQLWDRGCISVSRGLAGRIELDDRRLSLHWQIQPDAARSALHDPGLSTIGFWPRFLVACPPPYPPRKARAFRPDEDARITKFWGQCATLLRGPIHEDCSGLPIIEASPEALGLIKQFYERMEQMAKGAGGTLESVKPFALRGTEQLFRIAGTLAAFAGRRTIDAEAARDAMGLVLYSLETWRAIFGDREQAEAVRAALAFYGWLLKQPGNAATETAMLKIGPKPRSKDRRDTALAMLAQIGIADRAGDTWTVLAPKAPS